MSVRLHGQFLLAGAIGAILASLLIFLIPGPDGFGGPGSIPTNVGFVISGLFLWAADARERPGAASSGHLS